MAERDWFADFYRQHHREIHGYFARRAGRRIADDLAQETWLGFHVARRASRGDAAGLLRHIARCRLIDWIRTQARREELLESFLGDDRGFARHAGHGSEAGADTSMDVIAAIIAIEGRRDRCVLILTYLYDLDQYAVADALGIKVNDVKNSLRAGKQKLRAGAKLAGYETTLGR